MCGDGCLEIKGGEAEDDILVSPEMKQKIAAVKKADEEAGINDVPVTNEVARSLEGAE